MPGQVKAIIPKEFDSDAVEKVLASEMKKFAPFLVKAFERTTAGWQGDKPKFTPVHKVGGGAITIQIRLTGPKHGREKWRWLNDGTRPHTIRPKRAKTLRFQTGYQAGSRPGTTFTSRASRGGGWASAKEVQHPGTEPRDWVTLIIQDNQRMFERWMGAAMRQAARASGHGAK